MSKSYLAILICALSLSLIQAQNKTHTVVKGENVYRISLKYGVSMKSIFDANPGSETSILTGQVLSIPSSSATASSTTSQVINGTYVVQRGETKYRLSKRFGVSIEDLEALNPQIIGGLQAGHVIKIPEGGKPAIEQPAVADGPNTHKIKSGETIWSISQFYGIKVQPLLEANPGIDINDLQIGQNLRIPSNSEITPSSDTTYTVLAGDTVFGISQRFKVSIADLETLNPEIRNGLNEGQTIRLTGTPSAVETTNTQQVENSALVSDDGYVNYVIQPKETLYGLAGRAGMTISEFVDLNPVLETEVQVGTVIKMPANARKTEPQSAIVESNPEPTKVAPTVQQNETPIATFKTMSSLESTADKGLNKNVVWLLPQPLIELSSSNNTSNLALENYRGGHIAIDKLKEQGFRIEESLIDIASKSRTELSRDLATADLVIATNDVIANLTSIELKGGSTVLNLSSQHLNLKTLDLNPVASFEKQAEILFKVVEEKNGHVVVINDAKRSRDKMIIQKNHPNASFLKIKSNDTFNESDLVQELKASRLNMVIINSNKTSVFLNTTNALLRQYAKFDIQLVVLNHELIPSSDKISDKRFRILNLMFPSAVRLENLEQSNVFVNQYKIEYGEFPSASAGIGYDATYDALLRLFQSNGIGSSWPQHSQSLNFLDLSYHITGNETAKNDSVFIYKYKTDSGFEKIK